jgi:RecB family endonuclease NucS
MEPIIIPVEFKATHNKKVGIIPSEIEELAFADITVKTEDSDLRITEVDIEEFVRLHISLIFPDETLQIVGQQVINKEGGRSDLVAIDREGNIVLIELKRDQKDIIFRKEAFEFQAIRYAANYALIKAICSLCGEAS